MKNISIQYSVFYIHTKLIPLEYYLKTQFIRNTFSMFMSALLTLLYVIMRRTRSTEFKRCHIVIENVRKCSHLGPRK